ncbi:MAG: hypothetical protein LC135_01245 [Phycisphaerae bacterium]|nr:hypothetical protein [Phycisphaerae bacterium]MCZ2398477.1 hypothetical protein [Phycisphaerae bacterium]
MTRPPWEPQAEPGGPPGGPPGAAAPRRRSLALLSLARARGLQMRNALDQQIREAPLRTLAVAVLLVLIWVALYVLLDGVLGYVRRLGLVAGIANHAIFVHFFLVLAVMLAFSNAILTFSTLYGRHEAGHLLAMPVDPRQIVCAKWVEGMLLSSWSFLLLGGPLMLAVASNTQVEWYYYPLFLAHFVAFVAMPACAGLLAAWAIAMFAPRRPLRAVGAISVAIGLGALYWIARASSASWESERWVEELFGNLRFLRQPLMPNTWTANGIVAVMERDVGESLLYLGIVLGNAAFVSWATINVLGRSWPLAYSRALQGRYSPTIRRGWITGACCAPARLLLPRAMHRLLLKDVRHFMRDARQWTQIVIMFGLLLVYVANLQRLPLDVESSPSKNLMTFLNLTTVSLILATFTSRFVFPMVSLESQQLWLLELLPLRRVTLLLVKFFFALALTVVSAGGVMWLAVHMLDLHPFWSMVTMLVCLSICIGLSGLAIGLGARFPVFGQRNPARIAAGFGGTFNLIASMLFVLVEIGGVAILSLMRVSSESELSAPNNLTPEGWLLLSGLLGLGVVVATGALAIGAQHFNRLEG